VAGKGHSLYSSITTSSIAYFHSVYFHCTLPFCNTTTIAMLWRQSTSILCTCVVHTCYSEASCFTNLRKPAWTGSVWNNTWRKRNPLGWPLGTQSRLAWMEEPVSVATVAGAQPPALKESTGVQGGKRVWVVRKSGKVRSPNFERLLIPDICNLLWCYTRTFRWESICV